MTKTKSKRKKLYIFSGIAVLVIVGLLIGKGILENMVKKELLSLLNNNPESLYEISFSNVSLSLINGNFKIKDIAVSPREASIQQYKEGKIAKLLDSKISSFKIIGLEIIDFLKTKNIDISSVELDNIEIAYFINPQETKPEETKTLALHNIFSKDFAGAKLGNIIINNTTMKFYHGQEKENPFFEIDSVFVRVDDILLNPETLKNPIPVSFSDIRINTGQFEFNKMKFYQIYTTNIHFDVADTSLIIDGFSLIPKYSKEEHNKKLKYNDDRFDIKTKQIIFSGLNVDELEFEDILSFNKIEIIEPDISIYRDKRLPDAPFKYKPLIASLIKRIPIDIHIDSIQVTNGKLVYEEQVSLSDKPGKVFFDPLFISAYNITNVKDIIDKNPHLNVDFSGQIMGASQLEAHIDFNLARNDDYFEMTGIMNTISGTEFNPMLQHLALAKIVSCDVQKAMFSFSADDDFSQGNLILDYDNLEGELLKAKDENKKSGFLSWAAKGIVKKSNIPGDKKYRSGTIFWERRKDRGIINFLWKSAQSGIISIVAPIADKTKKQMKDAGVEEKEEMSKPGKKKKGSRKKNKKIKK